MALRFRPGVLGAVALVTAALMAALSGCAGAAGSATTLTKDSIPTEVGYSWDIASYTGAEPLKVDLSAEGPWVFPEATDWPVATTTIVDPAETPYIERFTDVTFVARQSSNGIDTYYPRRVSDSWVYELGKVTADAEEATSSVAFEPVKAYPLGFEVGDEISVSENEILVVTAKVLAMNAVTVPAGTIDNAYLVRFDYTQIHGGDTTVSTYYILAPKVGVVARFSVETGDEAGGFTALKQASVLASMPAK